MIAESTYTSDRIATICNEIERQWEYHLITRAAFPVDAVRSLPEYSSPPYYRLHGVDMHVTFKNPDSELFRRALKGVPLWLNQNFILRLFGLLDEHRVITAGKLAGNSITAIVAGLRHMVGFPLKRLPQSAEKRVPQSHGPDQGAC
jgi:hypothetical protein